MVVDVLRCTGTQINLDILSLVPQDPVNHNHVCHASLSEDDLTSFLFFCLPREWLTRVCVCVCVFESAHVHLSVNTLWLAGLPRPANSCTVWLTEACCSCVDRQQLLGWKNKMGEWWEAEREVERQKKRREGHPLITKVIHPQCHFLDPRGVISLKLIGSMIGWIFHLLKVS